MLAWLGKSLHQSYFVVFLCVGIIAGVVVGLVFRINYFASPMWLGFVAGVLALVYLKPKLLFTGLAMIAGMVLAFFRVSAELYGEAYVRQFYGQDVIVTGVVDGDPKTDENVTKASLKYLRFGEEGREASGKIYVSIAGNGVLQRADEVTLSGEMLGGFGTFAGCMYRPKVVEIRRPDPGDLVLAVRNWFAERVESLVPEPEVKLGLSYLLGMKTGLSDDVEESLRTVGLVHIVVASGTHLSILVEIARKIFGRLSRFAGLMFSVLFIVFFMSMVGWTPSILRAGVMAILTLVTWYSGRKIAPWRMILMVGAGTLLIDPMFVIDLGWLLSFASFAGIMMLGPGVTKFFYGTKKPGFVAETIITTVSATLMTLPIILYYYGQVSLVSVVANLIILPTLPWAMGLVFLTGVLVGVPFVEMAVGWCATRALDFHIAVVEFFGGMDQFLVKIQPYDSRVFLIYLFIIVLICGKIKRRK